ncbi:MAG: class I SAM-dependent methyltransferase [Gemmatimonadales bacterium]
MAETHFGQDHFSDNAPAYATYRPAYPDELFEWLSAVAPDRRLAVDCATGSGQAATGLARLVDRVLACDASRPQLHSAKAHPKIDYVVAPAEQLPVAGRTCSLVVAAQALHWFDWRAFFDEAGRVLRPGGIVACWTYGLMRTDAEVQQVVERLYGETLRGFWPPERRLVEEGYASIIFPDAFNALEVPSFAMEGNWTLGQMLGYIGTWSGVSQFRKRTGHDPLPETERAMARVWGDPSVPRTISWPLAIKVARLP